MASGRNSLFRILTLCVVCLYVINAKDNSQTGHVSDATSTAQTVKTNPTVQTVKTNPTVQTVKANPTVQTVKTNLAVQTVKTNPTVQTVKTNPTVQTVKTNPTVQTVKTNPTVQTVKTNPTVQTVKTNPTVQTVKTKHDDDAKSQFDSLLSSLSPSLLKLLQQVGGVIPGVKEALDSGLGLNTSQLKTINNFVQLLMKATNTNSTSLSDVLKSIQDSGLFDSVRNLISPSSVNAMPKDTAEMCDRVNRSTADLNSTLADLLNIPQPLGDDMKWAETSLRDALYWCKYNFTNTPIGSGAPKVLGGDIPTSYSTYNWKKCQADVSLMLGGLRTREDWVMQMLDATAKPGSGILEGNLKFLGNYKQCQDVSHRDPTSFSKIEGKICRAYVKPPFQLPPSFLTGGDVRIQWDLCLPKSCLDADLNFAIIQRNLAKNIWMSCTADLDISEDGPAIVAIVILALFGVLLVAGTIMEFCVKHTKPSQKYHGNGQIINGHANINHGFDSNEGKHHVTSFTEPNGKPSMVEINPSKGNIMYPEMNMNGSRSEHINGVKENGHNEINEVKDKTHKPQTEPLPRWQRALLAFSVPRNTEKILSVKSAPGAIGCLHGIRVLSMAWVILGHTIISMGMLENPVDLFSRIKTLGFQIILNAPLSVDTFFVMSGLLTCYLFMKTLGKKGKVTRKDMAMYYIHRYWRLTPSLVIWIMIVACLLQYVGEGRPAWKDYAAAENCRKWWWTNIVYINNVYKQSEPCVGVTWFLAHDMQFYIVAFPILVTWVYGWNVLGFLGAICYIGIHVSSTIWLEIKYNADLLRYPYTRVAPFAIGLMLGWILWRTKCKVRMNKCLVFMGWIVCFGLILTKTLVTYDENRDMPANDWTHAGRVVFETFYRPVWALAISWLIFACATGYGGYINSILSWEGWLPLSRLTYSAYLIHLTILGYETYFPEYTILFTVTSLSYQFLGTFVMAYGVGYLLTIAVESPMLALEKVVLG